MNIIYTLTPGQERQLEITILRGGEVRVKCEGDPDIKVAQIQASFQPDSTFHSI